jgi:hypothetical protein
MDEETHSGDEALVLGGRDFALVQHLAPERNEEGAIREVSPQGRYKKSATASLHQHGHGTFCTFHIAVPAGLVGVYALVVEGSVRYIGGCVDLGKRFNSGYGTISPRNCYKGGQMTNCKINHRVLEVLKAGDRVALYFHSTPQRKSDETQLIAAYSPSWKG